MMEFLIYSFMTLFMLIASQIYLGFTLKEEDYKPDKNGVSEYNARLVISYVASLLWPFAIVIIIGYKFFTSFHSYLLKINKVSRKIKKISEEE